MASLGARLATGAALLALAGPLTAAHADPLALWRIVHERCVVDQRANGRPAPCARVDLAPGEERGVAILKDLVGIAQFLAIPTARVEGIESPAILGPRAARYWSDAWAARSLMDAPLGRALPRDAIGLAINSARARSQDQLHIHIDCLDPNVRAALAGYRAKLTRRWRALPFALKGRRYLARRLDSPALVGAAPFALLASGVPGAARAMGDQTLVAVGATFPSGPGFILLADRSDPAAGAFAHGEDLLDHSCAVAGIRP